MRCDPSATEFDLYGDKKGACGESSMFISKVAVGNMQQNINENENAKASMSPAYDVYKEFSISDLQVNEIFNDWIARGKDKWNFDLRYATCKWTADNLEHIMESFIPASYPRTFVDETKFTALSIVALVVSIISIAFTIFTLLGIHHKHRRGKLGRAAQIEFLTLLMYVYEYD